MEVPFIQAENVITFEKKNCSTKIQYLSNKNKLIIMPSDWIKLRYRLENCS